MEKNVLAEIKNSYDAAIAEANAILKVSPVDFNAYSKAMADLDKAEKEYAKIVAITMYDEYAHKPNPIIEIIKAYSYVTLGHKEVHAKEDFNRIVEIKPIERERRIDLLAFCERAKLNTSWKYTVSKLNQLMCMRVAKELGADLEKIAKSYAMEEIAANINLGKTPTSNTQVCKLLQTVIDQMMPNEDEDGNPVYKCTGYDVRYLDEVYCKWSSKARLTVKVSNDSVFRRILIDIAYRLITNGTYDVDGYKVVKEA